MRNEQKNLLVIALITVLFAVLYFSYISLKNQERINIEIQASFIALQLQQTKFEFLVNELTQTNEENLVQSNDNLMVTLVDYYFCVKTHALGVTNKEVLNAVQTICAPQTAYKPIQFEDANMIFLNCFVDKGKQLTEQQNTAHITQQCIEYEQVMAKQITTLIEEANNK